MNTVESDLPDRDLPHDGSDTLDPRVGGEASSATSLAASSATAPAATSIADTPSSQKTSGRVLAYRGRATKLKTVIGWGAPMLVGFAILFGGGLWYINQLDSNIVDYMAVGSKYPEAEKPEYVVQPAEAVYDDAYRVSVLNGTMVQGLSASASEVLIDLGFNTSGTANASEAIEKSGVYYNNINAEGSARAVAKELGIETVELATAYQGVPITVLLGDDYAERMK